MADNAIKPLPAMRDWYERHVVNAPPEQSKHDREQAELHRTEPDAYQLVGPERDATIRIGKRTLVYGFCINSPGAGGYCDHETIWASDSITSPARLIQVCVHEGLHAAFPKLSEEEVDKAGDQIGEFVARMLDAKGVDLHTQLRPIADVWSDDLSEPEYCI